MQFIDRTKIIVKAGDGGHGKSAFRRENSSLKVAQVVVMVAVVLTSF